MNDKDRIRSGYISETEKFQNKDEKLKGEKSSRENLMEYYCQVVENSPNPIFFIDKDGVIQTCNDSCKRLFQYGQEIIGKHYSILINSPKEFNPLSQKVNQVFQEGISLNNIDINYKFKDGTCHTMLSRLYAIFDNNDKIKGCIFANTDITEWKRLEEALKDSEERLKIFFEFAPDAYYINDLKGTFIDGNKAAERMTGYKREELIGKSYLKLKLLPPYQIPKAAALLAKNTLGYPTGPDEFTLIRKDGNKVSLEIRTQPVKIKGQRLIIGIARDVTENKRIKEELKKSEEKYKIIFDLSPEVIVLLDKMGHVLDINPTMYEKVGYTPADILGMNMLKLPFFSKKEKLKLMSKFFQRMSGKEIPPYELEFIAKDGRKLIARVLANTLKDENGKIIQDVVMLSDITELKQTEEKLRRAYDDLELRVHERTKELASANEELKIEISKRKRAEEALQQKLKSEKKIANELQKKTVELSQTNKELDSFIYTVSHDLKAPLVSIQGFSAMLSSDYGDKLDEMGKMYLERMQKNSERMGELIDNLLELSRIGRIKSKDEIVNISEVISEITEALDTQLKARGTKLILKNDMPKLYSDHTRLSQVFSNLISNANKFMGDDNKEPTIEIGYSQDNGYHKFYVKDNGIGIDKEYHDKVFQIFQRLEEVDVEGTGIGLSIVKRIISNMNGDIWLDSEKGKGTTFYFTIPKTGVSKSKEREK